MRIRRSGFSLIELLVVIAIMAMLASILFPVCLGASETARATSCLSNCGQMGRAVMMYARDWGDTVPMDAHWLWPPGKSNFFGQSDSGASCFWWADAIMPYVNNLQVFVCPSRPRGLFNWEENHGKPMLWGACTHEIGYSINSEATTGEAPIDLPADQVRRISIGSVREPSRSILIYESGIAPGLSSAWQMVSFAAYAVQIGHKYKGNYTFFDGHAQAMTLRDTIKPKLMWNPMNRYPSKDGYQNQTDMQDGLTAQVNAYYSHGYTDSCK